MKAPSTIIQNDLSWSMQDAESLFHKAVSAHFFGAVFYACSVWYDNFIISYLKKASFSSLQITHSKDWQIDVKGQTRMNGLSITQLT